MILRDEGRFGRLEARIGEVYCYLNDSIISLVPDCDVEGDDFAVNRMTRLVRYYQRLEGIKGRYLASMN